jgi:hypothetical protein
MTSAVRYNIGSRTVEVEEKLGEGRQKPKFIIFSRWLCLCLSGKRCEYRGEICIEENLS